MRLWHTFWRHDILWDTQVTYFNRLHNAMTNFLMSERTFHTLWRNDVLCGLMTFLLTLWHTFGHNDALTCYLKPWRTFWRHGVRFEAIRTFHTLWCPQESHNIYSVLYVIKYFPYFLTSWRVSWCHAILIMLFAVMTYLEGVARLVILWILGCIVFIINNIGYGYERLINNTKSPLHIFLNQFNHYC